MTIAQEMKLRTEDIPLLSDMRKRKYLKKRILYSRKVHRCEDVSFCVKSGYMCSQIIQELVQKELFMPLRRNPICGHASCFFCGFQSLCRCYSKYIRKYWLFCVQRFSTTAGQSGRPHLKIMSKQDFSMLSKKQVHFVV